MIPRLRLLALLAIVAGFAASCQKKDPQEQLPPEAPDFFSVVNQSDSTVSLTWHDDWPDQHGFRLYIRRDTTYLRTDTLAADDRDYVVHGLMAGTTYRFRLTAYNDIGESDPTPEVTGHTTGNPPPEPPVNIQAQVLSASAVRVTWSPVGNPQNYVIGRRTSTADWLTMAIRPAADSSYTDSSVGPLMTYYYRVGAKVNNVISWSADSALAATPDGPPLAPDSLHATVLIGSGITLTWHDFATNEIGFEISRSAPGFGFQTIDSVSANDTSYADPLGNAVGDYGYRVRAFNSFGVSSWSPVLMVHYDYCSGGIIPLCRGNWWEYLVSDSVGPDYTLHREIVALDYPLGLDFFLLAQWAVQANPVHDTLDYLHNSQGQGCLKLSYPLPGNPSPQLLYKFPAQVLDHYFVDGDCVYVAGTSVDITVNNILYQDCYVYQRDFTSSYSLQIYLQPETVGIVREEEFVNSIRVVRRDLTNRHIQNQ